MNKWVKNALYVFVPLITFLLSTYLTIDVLLKTQDTTVCPDVRGKKVEEAKEIAKAKGLSLIVLRYERRNDVPYNHITVQKPDANITIRKGRILHVIVSEGPQLVEVPGLIGQTLERAAEMLSEKFITIKKTIYVPHAKTGRVVAQTPKGGSTMLEQGGIILVVGSEHKPYFLLPETKNLNIDDLLEEMEIKKIRYKVDYAKNDYGTAKTGFKTSVTPRTIFSNDNELVVNINPGG